MTSGAAKNNASEPNSNQITRNFEGAQTLNGNYLSKLLRDAKHDAIWSACYLVSGVAIRFALPLVLHNHRWDTAGYISMAYGGLDLASAIEERVMAHKLGKEIDQKAPDQIALRKYDYDRSSKEGKYAVYFGAIAAASLYETLNSARGSNDYRQMLGTFIVISAATVYTGINTVKALRRERKEAANIALRQTSESANN